jgi:hypothetical protein
MFGERVTQIQGVLSVIDYTNNLEADVIFDPDKVVDRLE